MSSPDAQTYYAYKHLRARDGAPYYMNASPSRRWVESFGSSAPIVALRIRERLAADPPSPYWGWLDAKRPDRYSMVWHTETQFEMCFTYGSKAEADRGNGRKVNLIVEEIPA